MKRVEQADALLDDVIRACGQGVADHAPEEAREFFREFLPIPRHLRALDPHVRLIIGDKGAGKTQLFKALKFPEGRRLLARIAASRGHGTLPLERSSWIVGFETTGSLFPASDLIDAYARGRGAEELRLLWLGLLAHVLVQDGRLDGSSLPDEVGQVLQRAAYDLDTLARAVGGARSQGVLFEALDELDRQLMQEDRYVFIVYDDLDRVSPGKWSVIQVALQGLIQLWAIYSRRWQRIRCKIFLRRDLYERAALRGPDIAKIAWHPADLFWSPGDIYRLLFKRLLNVSEGMKQYLSRAKLQEEEDEFLGWIPAVQDEKAFSSAVKHMFGEYMGTDPRKGLTLRWIPNHLKDGHDRIFPRSALRLIEEAANSEKRSPRAERPNLIHYTSLRVGLDRVSEFRVNELAQEEFPWIRLVQKAFDEAPPRVPAERREMVRALQINWSPEGHRPPDIEPDALLDYLVELGIASTRTDGRVDVGDLYLKGLHLKRKGGVARPKT
ncbi:MAG: hypothetical protein JXB05_11040 [Myxococcaceae bacterium]|nr:hypothetical protein [Myxococcaceae bacterium]